MLLGILLLALLAGLFARQRRAAPRRLLHRADRALHRGEPEHAAALAAGVGNLNVSRWIPPVPHPYTVDHAATFIAKLAQPFPRHAFIFRQDALIGSIAIGLELGYWIAEEHWGRGYASEAARRIVDAYFQGSAAQALASNHAPNNYRSAGVLHRLGFRPTGGRRRSHVMSTGETVELVELRLDRRDWEAAALPDREAMGQGPTPSSSEAIGQTNTPSSSEAVGQKNTPSSSAALGQKP